MARQTKAATGDGGAHEQATAAATEKLAQSGDQFAPVVDTIAGDLRDFFIQMWKDRPKPWSQTSNGEQNDIVRAVEYAVRNAVAKSVDLIATNQMADVPIRAILESYADKGDIKAVLKIKTADDTDAENAVLALHRAQGKLVLISKATPADYLGERGQVQTDADDPALPFADDRPDHPADDSDLSDGDDAARENGEKLEDEA
jgi:hypothetical protein